MKEVNLLKPCFSDHRGSITDIFVKSPKDHCAIITTAPGHIRANHYHKFTTQYTFLVHGKMLMASVEVSKNGGYDQEAVEIITIPTNTLVVHPPYKAHAFKAVEESTILAFACGIRGGDQYESDVFRLEECLFSNSGSNK